MCKTYPPWRLGFTLTMLEYVQTIPTFWDTMLNFLRENPHYLAKDNAMEFLSNDGGRSYSLCHCECGCPSPALEAPFRVVIMIPNDAQSGAILKSLI